MPTIDETKTKVRARLLSMVVPGDDGKPERLDEEYADRLMTIFAGYIEECHNAGIAPDAIANRLWTEDNC